MPTAKTEQCKYKRIAEELTVAVRKEYKPGEMLPSENVMARKFSVTPVTLRKALGILSDNGLVERYHRRGTVVKDPLAQGEFAIVLRPKLLEDEASSAFRKIASLLSENIGARNTQWHTKLHLGKKVDSDLYAGQLFPATLDLLEPDVLKRLRGVFTFHPLHELMEPLRQKNIPIITIAGEDREANVEVVPDLDVFYRESINHLCHVGCKTVGFMWTHMGKALRPELRDESHLFDKYAVDAGFAVKEQWLPAVINDITERKAYDTFVKFWQQGDCPDGLVISDDVIAKGVLRAVLHKNIRVPEQIRLITYANKGIELPFHKPVTRYEFDLEEVASLAVETMIKLINGRKCEQHTSILGKLIKGETT